MDDTKRAVEARKILAEIALSYSAIGADLGAIALGFGRSEEDQLRADLLATSYRLGHLGDRCHDTRRALRGLAGIDDGGVSVDESRLTTTGEITPAPEVLTNGHARHGWRGWIRNLIKGDA